MVSRLKKYIMASMGIWYQNGFKIEKTAFSKFKKNLYFSGFLGAAPLKIF